VCYATCVFFVGVFDKFLSFFFFFFFQAEDGIRDFHVTGVQTCALPILFLSPLLFDFLETALAVTVSSNILPKRGAAQHTKKLARSEERRVGKECRSRWSPDQ